MSPMFGESLSVIIQVENSQRILLMSNHRQWLSPMSATYENQPSAAIEASPTFGHAMQFFCVYTVCLKKT